jgi:hypothetical protein
MYSCACRLLCPFAGRWVKEDSAQQLAFRQSAQYGHASREASSIPPIELELLDLYRQLSDVIVVSIAYVANRLSCISAARTVSCSCVPEIWRYRVDSPENRHLIVN